MWKVRVKPGKPLVYGRIGGCDLLGLPGNPVSTFVTFCLFVRPFILRRMGVADAFPVPALVPARFEWPRPGGRREYTRARLAVSGGWGGRRRDLREAGFRRALGSDMGHGAGRDLRRDGHRAR